VVPTVDDEEYAFFGAQNTRAMAIEMAEMPEAEDDGVLRRNRPSTGRADPRLWFHPDSQEQTGCQRAMPQTPRDRWATRARPVEKVKKKLQAVIETTLPRTQGVSWVPKRRHEDSCHRRPAERHDGRSVQRRPAEQVSLGILRRDPSLKRDPTRTRPREQVAIPRRLSRVCSLTAVLAVVAEKRLELSE